MIVIVSVSHCLGIINEVRGGWVPSGQGTSVTDLLTCDNPMSVHYTAPPSPGLTPANPLPADKVQCQPSIMMNQCFLLQLLECFCIKSFRTKHIIVSVKYPESSWLILKVCGIFVQIGET